MSFLETCHSDVIHDTLVLSTVTCMAACSFEAYDEPTAGTSCEFSTTGLSVTNTSVGGTSVQYVDTSIVQELFSHAMLLHVGSGWAPVKSTLLLPEVVSYMLEVSVGGSYARTSTRRAPLWRRQNIVHLEWNEKVTLWPAGPSNAADGMLQNHKAQVGKQGATRMDITDEGTSRTNKQEGFEGFLGGHSQQPRPDAVPSALRADLSPLRHVSPHTSPSGRSTASTAASAEGSTDELHAGSDNKKLPRSSFPAAPIVQVRLYKVGVTGREQVMSKGEVLLPPDWSSSGSQDFTVDLFEVQQGSGRQQRHTRGSTTCVPAGRVHLQALAINEPGSPKAPSAHTQQGDTEATLTAFHHALTSPKPQFVNHGGLASAVTGAVPGKVAIKESWQVLCKLFPDEAFSGAQPIAFVSSRITHTQAWVHCNRKASTVIVSFRGTEGSKLRDIRVDATFFQQPFPVHPADWQLLPSSHLQRCVTQSKVHRGFIWAWESVVAQVSDLVRACTASVPNARWNVVCVGHSLGGALATLTAFDFAIRRDVNCGDWQVSCYTYGSPRVGNPAFSDAFSQLVKPSWRIHTFADAVPRLPPRRFIWRYQHVHALGGVAGVQFTLLFLCACKCAMWCKMGLSMPKSVHSLCAKAIFRTGGTVVLKPHHPISFSKQVAVTADGMASLRESHLLSWWNWSLSILANLVSIVSTVFFAHFPDAYLEIMADSLRRADSTERVQNAVTDVKRSLRKFRRNWGIIDFR